MEANPSIILLPYLKKWYPTSVETLSFQEKWLHARVQGPLRFEARWLQEDTLEEMVKAAWKMEKAREKDPSLMHKVNGVHSKLHTWDKQIWDQPGY
jgi:hypothetical protein